MSKKTIYLTASTIGTALLLSAMCGTVKMGIHTRFSMIYGWIDVSNFLSLTVSLTRWILPQVILCGYLGNYLEEQLLKYMPYVLTRSHHPQKIFGMFYGKLIGVAVVQCMIFILIPYVMEGLPRSQMSILIFEKMGIWFVYQLCMILVINGLSTFFTAIGGFGISIGGEVLCFLCYKMILNGTISETVLRFLPVSSLIFFDGNALKNVTDITGIIGFVIFAMVVTVGSIQYSMHRDTL